MSIVSYVAHARAATDLELANTLATMAAMRISDEVRLKIMIEEVDRRVAAVRAAARLCGGEVAQACDRGPR